MRQRSAHRELWDVHLAVTLFGVAGLFGKLVHQPAMTIVLGRSFFAAVCLLPIVARSAKPLHLKNSALALLLSGLLLALHWVAFFRAIQLSTVAVGLLTFCSFPLFATILEPPISKERFRAADALVVAIVVIGIYLVVPPVVISSHVTRGAARGVLSGALFALLSILNRRLTATRDPAALAGLQNAIAAAVLAPLVFSTGGSLPGLRDLILLLLLGVFCTALAHTLFIRSLRRLHAQTASMVAALEPVYGIALAWLFLGETPAQRTLLGGAIVVAGVILATRVRRTASPLAA